MLTGNGRQRWKAEVARFFLTGTEFDLRVGNTENEGGIKNHMLIPVLYENQKLGMVYPCSLEKLISCRKIRAFRRSSGWVFLEDGPIRKDRGSMGYSGPERRADTTYLNQVELILEGHEILFEYVDDK